MAPLDYALRFTFSLYNPTTVSHPLAHLVPPFKQGAWYLDILPDCTGCKLRWSDVADQRHLIVSFELQLRRFGQVTRRHDLRTVVQAQQTGDHTLMFYPVRGSLNTQVCVEVQVRHEKEQSAVVKAPGEPDLRVLASSMSSE